MEKGYFVILLATSVVRSDAKLKETAAFVQWAIRNAGCHAMSRALSPSERMTRARSAL